MSSHKCMKCIHGGVCGDFEGSHSKNCEYFLPESEWISVTDRLPEDCGRYLVCLGENDKRAYGNGVHMAWYYSGSKNWSFSLNTAILEGKESSTQIHSVDVTHYMPLPEPPTEDNT